MMRNSRIIVFFLVALLLSMPFSSASFISNIVATGSDGVRDVITQNDSVDFDIYVDLEIPSLGPEDVAQDGVLIVRGSEQHSVSDCSWDDQSNLIVKCSKTLDINTIQGSGIYSYDVLLSGFTYVPQPYLYVDTTAPSFAQTDISVSQNGSSLLVTVSSADQADFSSVYCSGLDYFEVFANNNSLGTANFDGNCSSTATGEFAVNSALEGSVQICAQVYDSFGASTQKCTYASLDLAPPVIQEFSFTNTNGNPLKATSQNGGTATVSYEILETESIASSSVHFNSNNLSSVCQLTSQTGNGKIYSCMSEEFIVTPGVQSATIIATDSSGNIASEVLSMNLIVDSQSPVFSRFENAIIDDRIYVSDTTKIGAYFSDASLYDANMNLVLGSNVFPANSCAPSGSLWLCNFTVSVLPEGEYPVQFTGFDDFQNQYAQLAIPLSFIVDRTNPQVGSFVATGIIDIGEIPVVSVPGRVDLNVEIADDSPVFITADFSQMLRVDGTFDREYNIVSTSCSETSCNVTSAQFGIQEVTTIPVFVSDAAGNTVSRNVTILVRSQSESSYPWATDSELSPSALDRSLSLITPQKAFAQIELIDPLGEIQDIVDITFLQCVTPEEVSQGKDPNVGGREFLQDISFVSQEGALTYLSFQTLRSDFFLDQVSLDCRFRVTAYSDDELYVDDPVTVRVTIPFFNNPVGFPDKALEEKIESAVEDTQGMLETLDEIYNWVLIIQKICNVISTITNLVVLIQPFLQAFGLSCDSIRIIPVVGPLAYPNCAASGTGFCEGKEVANTAIDGVSKVVGMFCAFISCEINFCSGGFTNFGDNVQAYFSETTSFKSINSNGNFNSVTPGSSSPNQNLLGAFDATGNTVFSQNSLPNQICTLCIPGLLKKFHDYRQIQCGYALCLIEQTSLGMVSEGACDEIKASMECKYWAGELFSNFPFAHIWDNIVNLIAQILADPIAAYLMIGNVICIASCKLWFPNSPGTMNTYCSFQDQLNRWLQWAKVLVSIKDSFDNLTSFEKTQDSCEAMDLAYESFKSQQESFNDRLEARRGVTG